MQTVVEVTENHSAIHSLPAEAPGRRLSHKGPCDTVRLQTEEQRHIVLCTDRVSTDSIFTLAHVQCGQEISV